MSTASPPQLRSPAIYVFRLGVAYAILNDWGKNFMDGLYDPNENLPSGLYWRKLPDTLRSLRDSLEQLAAREEQAVKERFDTLLRSLDDHLPIVEQYWFPEQEHSSNLNSNDPQKTSPPVEEVHPNSKQQKRRQDTTLTWEDVFEKANFLEDCRDEDGVFPGDYEEQLSRIRELALTPIKPVLSSLKGIADQLRSEYECFFELGKFLQEKIIDTDEAGKLKKSKSSYFQQAINDSFSIDDTLRNCSLTVNELSALLEELPDHFSMHDQFCNLKTLVVKILLKAQVERPKAKVPNAHPYKEDLPKISNREWRDYVISFQAAIFEIPIPLREPTALVVFAYLMKNTHTMVTYKMIAEFMNGQGKPRSKSEQVKTAVRKISTAIKKAFSLTEAKPFQEAGNNEKAKKGNKVKSSVSGRERQFRIWIEGLEAIVRQQQEVEITKKLSCESVFKSASISAS